MDQTVPQSKRELLRQMSSPREDDKERVNRKVDGQTHPNLHTHDIPALMHTQTQVHRYSPTETKRDVQRRS